MFLVICFVVFFNIYLYGVLDFRYDLDKIELFIKIICLMCFRMGKIKVNRYGDRFVFELCNYLSFRLNVNSVIRVLIDN